MRNLMTSKEISTLLQRKRRFESTVGLKNDIYKTFTQ